MHILSYFHKYDSHARVLTYRYRLIACNVDIPYYIVEHVFAHRRSLPLCARLYTFLHITGKIQVSLYAKLSYQLFNFFNIYLAHIYSLRLP